VTPVFSHRLEVRFRDCDAFGHVNNAVYLTYLEQARFAHWRALDLAGETSPAPAASYDRGPFGTPGGAAPGLPGVILARVEIDYRRAARYGDVLEIALGIAAVGNTSFTYEYEVRDVNGGIVATARTVIVCYDYTAGTPVQVPGALKRALTRPVQPA
jgi:acyl-CoA thioester hydrolase